MADIVKAEYFSAKDKSTGEIKEIHFIPPAPSDGDLGGISKEKLDQIDELKGDLVKASNGIVNDIDLSFIDTLTSEGSYFMDVAIPKGFNIIFENKSSLGVTVNLCYGNEEKNYGGVDPNKSIEIEAPFFVDKIRSYCNGTDVNIHIKAINPKNTSIINIEKNIEDTNELLKNINEGIDVAVTDTIGSIGNYNYYIEIPKGYKCIFYNTSQYSCSLNISDGENEINLTDSILPNTQYDFESPFYIKKIRCYWGGTDVSFKIKALNSVDENMKMINNALQGFFYISGNGDIKIDVDGAFVDVKVNSNGFSYRHPSFYQTVSPEDVLNSIDGSTYSDGVLAFRIPETNYLIYDISENKLKITPIEINDNSIILIKNWYGNVSGYWIELYGYRQANRNIISIENLESRTFNSPPMYMLSDEEVKTKSKEYSSLFANVSAKTEQFLFMTDTHYYNNILDETENPQKYIATISKIYHSTPASYVLDGGDWIDYFNDVNDYCYTMGLIKGVCDSLLSPHYFALGNHDTNYQSGTEANKVVQKALWFPDKQHTYYSFIGDNTKWFIFDSGVDTDANTVLRNLDVEQIKWVCSELLNNDNSHIAMLFHMLWNDKNSSGERLRTKLSYEIEKIIIAFNRRSTYTYNDKIYDFTNSNGTIEFIMCGHIHGDNDGLYGNVPVISTETARQGFKATFDLCLADYGNKKLHLVRVGVGENRTFDLP